MVTLVVTLMVTPDPCKEARTKREMRSYIRHGVIMARLQPSDEAPDHGKYHDRAVEVEELAEGLRRREPVAGVHILARSGAGEYKCDSSSYECLVYLAL